jgi:hypothetical protein
MPETYEIELYCREPSHAEKRWNICKFIGTIGDDGEPTGWMPEEFFLAQSVPRQMLEGTRLLPFVVMHEIGEDFAQPPEARWPLRCEKCNLSVPVRAGTAAFDRLMDALNKLAAHGVPEISLATLAANL